MCVLTYIQPGKPQQNAYVERYNRAVRHERLDLYTFETIEEVQEIVTEWPGTYNIERPNLNIGGITHAMKLRMAAWILRLRPPKTGGLPSKKILLHLCSKQYISAPLSNIGFDDIVM